LAKVLKSRLPWQHSVRSKPRTKVEADRLTFINMFHHNLMSGNPELSNLTTNTLSSSRKIARKILLLILKALLTDCTKR
jgi:hypothetical protein